MKFELVRPFLFGVVITLLSVTLYRISYSEPPSQKSTQEGKPGIKWEYRFFECSADPESLLPGYSSDLMSKYGSQGWEIVPLQWSNTKLLFRREKA